MNALSLFSGIGGIDLACEWVGIKTVAFCEREPFCQKVLRKHWPNVTIYDDVCTLTREVLERDGIGPIDLIHGGDPCQPYSVAGKRRGAEDDRALWPEVKRLLQEIRPRWYLRENVAGNISLGLDDVLSDLESIGYTAQAIGIPACAVGALHRRDRVFVLAHAYGQHVEGNIAQEIQGEPALQGFFHPGSIEEWARRSTVYQPKLLGNFNGLPDQVDRVTALGNAVVPQQVYPILAAIKLIDDWMRGETS